MGRRRGVTGSTLTDEAGPSSLPVEGIAHNPRNARDDYGDVGELADSIRAAGILQPLSVVRQETFLSHFPEHEHEIGVRDWVVIAGNRRLAAAREVGWSEVPVRAVDHLGRDGMLDEAVLVENIHRADLPPLREAQALRLLVERHGSQAAVARRIGKSSGFVSQRLMLLDLPADKQAALQAGTLTVEQARSAAAASEQNAASDYGVNGRAVRAGRPRKARDPVTIVANLRRDLTSDELAEVVRLLTANP